jgi:hypothetical protein
MIPLPLIGLGKLLVSGVTSFFSDKAAITRAKVEGEIKTIQQAAGNAAEWEMLHARGSQTSWKDEYVLILFSIPTVMSFIPFLEQYAISGFAILHTLPEWYRYTFVTIALASYGIKMKDIFWKR